MTAESTPNDPPRQRDWSQNRFATLLHLPPLEMWDGGARLEFVVEEIHLRPGGVVHGGVFATVLDTVTGYVGYIVGPPNHEVLTMQLNVNMTSTAKLGDRLIATAKALHSGRRTAVVHGELRREDGKLLATGSATLFFVKGEISS